MSFNMNFNMNLLGGSHLLRALGLDSGGFMDQLSAFHQHQLGMLRSLSDSFGLAAGSMGASMLANLLQSGGIPGQGVMNSPNMGGCCCPGQYAQPRNYDLGATPGQFPFSIGALMQRGRAAQFERALSQNPFMKAQAEMLLGGRIVSDGAHDGRIRVEPFPGGANPSGSAAANAAMGFLDQIQRAAMGSALPMMGPAIFQNMMAGALQSLMGQMSGLRQPGQGSPFVDWAANPGGGNPQAQSNVAPNRGLHGPAVPGPYQDDLGLGSDGDASHILNDPSLTVEDKVTLMIMLIMKKMDKDIEEQANYINDLQQQSGSGGGGGKGGKGGGGGGSSPSIDVETMKLKRMIDKRSQMFDMLRQIIDKYNETAKNIIQSIGR